MPRQHPGSNDSAPISITVWEIPAHKFPSQYGPVAYGEWCELEVDRMNAAAGRNYCRVGALNNGVAEVVAVVRNPIN